MQQFKIQLYIVLQH